MFKIIAITLVLAIAGVLGYAATRPNDFRVERSVSIHAPAEAIYPLVANLHSWTRWSPYDKLDPAMQRSYSGPESGVGAAMGWSGDNKAGEGRMEVVEALPPNKVAIKLDFVRPFESHSTAKFALLPMGDTTTVSWSMYGPASFVTKLMSVFFDMDQMIGKDFEAGLATLKGVAENQAAPAAAP